MEGVLIDESSMMSSELDRLSDVESNAVENDHFKPSSVRSSLHSYQSDRLYILVKCLFESGHWDSVLPKYEKNILNLALQSVRNWKDFLEVSNVPLSSSNVSSSSKTSISTNTKKNSSANVSKTSKASTRSKRSASTPRRGKTETEQPELSHSSENTNEYNSNTQNTSKELLETLHTRIRTLVFDTLVDEVLFPNEKYLNRIPVRNQVKKEFGIPKEPLELEPFFTLEDLKEAREVSQESLEKENVAEYQLIQSNEFLGNATSRSESPFFGSASLAAPSTPNADKSSSKPKRKTATNRELRNLITDSKQSRKSERLDILGASQDFRAFVFELDKIVATLKENRLHAPIFLRGSRLMDSISYSRFLGGAVLNLDSLSKNIENLIYVKKSEFAADLLSIFTNCRNFCKNEPGNVANSSSNQNLDQNSNSSQINSQGQISAYFDIDEIGESKEEVLEHCEELEKVANNLLSNSNFDDQSFESEKERMKDLLPHVIPEIYGIETNMASNNDEIHQQNAPFDEEADLIKRNLFFKEDPCFTKWRNRIQSLIENGHEEVIQSGLDKTSSSASNIDSDQQNQMDIDQNISNNQDIGGSIDTNEEEVSLMRSSNSQSIRFRVVPDPLFRLPEPEMLPFQWHSSIPSVSSSLDPLWPVSQPFPPSTVYGELPPPIFTVCSAQAAATSICLRNQVLMQRIRLKTEQLGHAPLDPTISSSSSSVNSTSTANIKEDPTLPKTSKSTPIIKKSSAASKTTPLNLTPSKTTPLKNVPSTPSSVSKTTSNITSNITGNTNTNTNINPTNASPSNVDIKPSSSLTEPKSEEVDSTQPISDSIPISSTESQDMNIDTNISDDHQIAPPEHQIPALFSDENKHRDFPASLATLNEDASLSKNLASSDQLTCFDDLAANDLLKQSVALQLAMTGFTDAQQSSLNVLTDILGSFISRIGFLANTYMSSPGTTLSMNEIMHRTLSEVYPRGIKTVKSFITSEIMKSDNCLRTVDASTVYGWIEDSPSLSNAFNNPPQKEDVPEAPSPFASSEFNPTSSAQAPTTLSPIESLLNQLKTEQEQDASAMAVNDTREFYLQHAPFTKKTSSYSAYRPQTIVGSTSNIPVGTPGGLHLVLPPSSHHHAAAVAAAAAQQTHQMAAANPSPHHHPQAHASQMPPPGPQGHHTVHMPPHHQPIASPSQPQQGHMSHQAQLMQSGQPQQNMAPSSVAQGGQMAMHGVPRTGAVMNPNAPQGMQNRSVPQGAHPSAQGPPQRGMVGPVPGGPKKHMGAVQGQQGMQQYPMNTGQPGHMQQAPGSHVQPMNPGYMSPRPTGSYSTGQQQPYVQQSSMPTQQGTVSLAGAKKGVVPPISAQAKQPGRPRVHMPPAMNMPTPAAVPDDSQFKGVDEPSPRATSAKRKRPQGMTAAVPEEPSGDDEGSGRRTRNRRGMPATNFSEEYYYNEEEDFDEGPEGEPKKKRRKTPAKTKKH